MSDVIFTDWRYRWSMLCRSDDGWRVIVDPGGWCFDGEQRWYEGPFTRPVHWWSPRDLIRFPLHKAWVRRYW